MKNRAQVKQGFTLIELVLVTSMLAVIGLTLYGTFTNGINIWKTVTQESTTEDISLFFEKISHDLRNSFKMTGVRFKGGKHEVSFPARIKYKGDDGLVDSIGRVTYSYDRRKKALKKEEMNYNQIFKKKPGLDRVLTEAASSLNFKYFVYDSEKKDYSWVTSWQESDETFGRQIEESLPLIVRVEVGIPGERGEQKFVKNIALPSACCWPFIDEE